MKTIKFLEDCELESFGRGHPDNPKFTKDDQKTLRNDQADRWLRRKKAELIEDLGPDELEVPGVEAGVIHGIRDEVERRNANELDGMADDIASARDALMKALS